MATRRKVKVPPLGAVFLHLDLPSEVPGANSHRRITVVRCKPSANPHDSSDGMLKYLLVGLLQYVLKTFTKESRPYRVTQDDVSTPLQRSEGNQAIGRGSTIAIMYEAR